MAYRDNWLTHMLATVNGKGFDDYLARDFWTPSEDLWNHRIDVRRRWLKLWFVYVMSGLAQVSLPLFILGAVLLPFTKHGDWRWWLIGVATSTPFIAAGAILSTTRVYLKLLRERGELKRPATAAELHRRAHKSFERTFWFAFVVCPFVLMAWLIYSGHFPL